MKIATYEFESDTAGFYAADGNVEEDTRALCVVSAYMLRIALKACSQAPRLLLLTGIGHDDPIAVAMHLRCSDKQAVNSEISATDTKSAQCTARSSL